MQEIWWNDYVGIPYADRGRTRSGADCYGLVRLVHEEQFGNRLPSFVDDYESATDREHLEELIARNMEGWRSVDVPASGDVALFRILGNPAHVGVITRPGYFLHVRSGKTATVERLGSPEWSKRLTGIYRYTPGTGVTVAGCIHPLRTEQIRTCFPAGMTIAGMVDALKAEAGVDEDAPFRAHVWVDGRPVHPDDRMWVPSEGARIEIRAVPQGDILRSILMLAVVVAAAFFAPILAGALGFAATGIAASLIQIGLVAAGALLVNFIFPVRPAKQPRDPRSQNLLVGGQNQVNLFGAIPIVLGRHRFTPPLAANQYVESNATKSYLKMALCWGYGPLQVSDLRIGETKLDRLEEVEYETLVGEAGESKARFNSIYGRDVTQVDVSLALECPEFKVASASRTSNVITVTTTEDHDYAVGWDAKLNTGQAGSITSIPTAKSFTFADTGSNGTIAAATVTASEWTTRTIGSEVEKVTVTLHFPEGLRLVSTVNDKTAADEFRARVQVRQLDSDDLTPLTSWGNINEKIKGLSTVLGRAWYNTDNDAALEKVYRWTRFSVDAHSKIIVRTGAFTASPSSGPSGTLLTRLQEDNFGLNVTFDRLPEIPDDEEPLWDVQVYGDEVYDTVDRRSSDITGCDLDYTPGATSRFLIIESGTIDRAQYEVVRLGGSGEPYRNRKDAFTYNISFDVPSGAQEVRVRRLTADNSENGKTRRFATCYLQAITGYANNRPITPPAPLAMTAIRIKATNQLNGNIDGITGTVQSVCLDWDSGTSAWVERPTRNPASLFRYVLQHPANAQAVADSMLDLDAIQDFHEYCTANAWRYDAVVTEQRSLWDMLLDICAAGRASPTRRDGKYTVIIDQPRSEIAQHFTPHNSWGFEGVRSLPKLPHAFRVQYYNAKRGYQLDERIVYNDGYSESNATLFEQLQLPGVTDSDTIFKHARFHFAQLKLRPETYTLNADIEHLVCTRGDLVRVTHDVPLWGLATGRIKERTSSTVLELDEAVPMQAATTYTIRIRLADGSSITRTVASVGSDGNYTSVTLTASVTTDEGAPGNLFMFGALDSESVELIVLGIEPAENMTARLTLVDYSPAVYDSDDETIPAFDSQITLPPKLMQTAIAVEPTIVELKSDESVLERLTGGSFRVGLRVAFEVPVDVPTNVEHIQAEISDGSDGLAWTSTRTLPLDARSTTFFDVEEGADYQVRLRFLDREGRSSAWVVSDVHTVVGKTTQPDPVTGLTLVIEDGKIVLSWDANPEIDIVGYEVRTADSGFGSAGFLFRGDATTVTLPPPATGSTTTYYVRALDAAGLYSTASAAVAQLTLIPGAIANLRAQVVDNNVLLFWDMPEPTSLPIRYARIKKGAVWGSATLIGTKDGAFTSLQETAGGTYTYQVAAVDVAGNEGPPAAIEAVVLEPPDFVFNGEFESDFGAATLSNALEEDGALVLPVDTTETWAAHFTGNSWATPQAQIDAGYPIFIQPAEASGYYEETFDFGTTLGSSKITVNVNGAIVSGSPTTSVTISTSPDGSTWTDYPGVTSVYAFSFRYVKIRFAVTAGDGIGLYRLNSLTATLDAKLRNDAGAVSAVSTDTAGTVTNLNKEFLDLTSITLTPAGTSQLTAVYDFQDSVIDGTYSVASNVCTVTATAHDLVVGQNVRLAFSSGTAPSGVYAVASVTNANVYTVAITTANTSGAVSTYPQGFRTYLFNAAGARVSGTVSWSVKGY